MLRALDRDRFPLFPIAGWIESTAIADHRLRGRRIELAQEAKQRNHSSSPTRQPSSGSVCDQIKFSPRVCRNSRCVISCEFASKSVIFRCLSSLAIFPNPVLIVDAWRRSNFSKFLNNQRHAGSLLPGSGFSKEREVLSHCLIHVQQSASFDAHDRDRDARRGLAIVA